MKHFAVGLSHMPPLVLGSLELSRFTFLNICWQLQLDRRTMRRMEAR